MKTKYILLILTAWLTASCSLQEDTEGFSTPGDFYKTKTQCQSAVNSCYIPLKNLYTYKMMIATEGVTDLMYIASGTQDAQLDVERLASPADVFAESDIVSLHIPLTDETRGVVNRELLSRMKPKAVLVNTARKEVVDEAALLDMMAQRPGLSYATDIKPDADADFVAGFADRYFATPKKMGAQTAEANINAGIAAARQIVAFLRDGDETFRVNK